MSRFVSGLLKEYLMYVLIFLIASISFYFYSTVRFPLATSDDALNVLMAHYYSLPHDVYCWGQDRGGTLIPLMAQVFIKLFNSSAVWAVSLANYLILLVGYFSFASFFKSWKYKIFFALLWFFPFQRFVDLLRFPIGLEYSLLALILFVLFRLLVANDSSLSLKRGYLMLIFMLMVLSLWVSDLSIVNFVVLFFVLFLNYRKSNLKKYILGVGSSFLILSSAMIIYLKSFAFVKTGNYLSLNNWYDIADAFAIVVKAFRHAIMMEWGEHLVSVGILSFFLFFISYFIFLCRGGRYKTVAGIWLLKYFVLDLIVVLFVLFIAHWVLMNSMGRWYFVSVYISLSMAILLSMEYFEVNAQLSKLVKGTFILYLIIACGSPIYTLQFNGSKSLRPAMNVAGDFKRLAPCGVIGDYWNSYIIAAPYPDLICATPHDECDVRNIDLVDSVFAKPSLYLIRDNWMPIFPDTVRTLGRSLLRRGDPFELSGCKVCKYEVVK